MKDDFVKGLEKANDCAQKLRSLAYDMNTSKDSVLMYDSSDMIENLVKLVKCYENNTARAMKAFLKINKDLGDYAYKWTLAESILDKKTANAIKALAQARKGGTYEASGTAGNTCDT